jgi:hypothetical protein
VSFLKGGDTMTVGTQMEQVIASIESASASLKTFALQTQDKNMQKEYSNMSQNLENTLTVLKGRQKHIEEQEPQYKQQ